MNEMREEYEAGPFVLDVRRGKVKAPQQRAFTVEAWKQGLEKHGEPGLSDLRLYLTGMWFAIHFNEVRRLTDACAAAADLRNPLSVSAILAAANREAVVLKKQMAEMMKGRDSFTIQGLDQMKLKSISGNPLYFSSVVDTLIDGLKFPLKRASDSPQSAAAAMTDSEWQAHVGLLALGGYYFTLEHYWMECVWNGYALDSTVEPWRLRSFNHRFHQTRSVTSHRQQAINHERAMHAMDGFNRFGKIGGLDEYRANKTVLSLFKKGGRFRVKAASASRFKDSMNSMPTLKDVLFEPHLARLFSRRYACLKGLSIQHLLDGFDLINAVGNDVIPFFPEETLVSTWAQAERLVPRIELAEFTAAFVVALRISQVQANFLTDYMIWKPGYRNELWFSPFVRIGERFVSFAAVATTGINFVRLVDQLVSEHDEIKRDADQEFERYIRGRLHKVLSQSAIGGSVRMLDRAFKPAEPAVGDIDLLFCFGRTIWVGEAKSSINPYEPIEDFRFMEMLITEAVPQILRKCAYVKTHLAEIIDLLDASFDPTGFSVEPFVVISHSLFAGCRVKDVPVVDREIIELYFAMGKLRQMAYTTEDGETRHLDSINFYSDLKGAEANFRAYLLDPPQLDILKKYLREDVSKFIRSEFSKLPPAEFVSYTVELPTAEIESLIEKVARARGDWAGRSETL